MLRSALVAIGHWLISALSSLAFLIGPLNAEPSQQSYMLAFADTATAAMTKRIRQGAATCERLPWVYRYDCLSDTFRAASRLNRDKPDYSDARVILADAGKKLDALVAQNLDKSKPKVKLGRKSYRPVKESNRAAISKAGRAVVQEAETRLLRAGGIQKRQEHYQRIAAAVDATELLLRAGLIPTLPRVAVLLASLQFQRIRS